MRAGWSTFAQKRIFLDETYLNFEKSFCLEKMPTNKQDNLAPLSARKYYNSKQQSRGNEAIIQTQETKDILVAMEGHLKGAVLREFWVFPLQIDPSCSSYVQRVA